MAGIGALEKQIEEEKKRLGSIARSRGIEVKG